MEATIEAIGELNYQLESSFQAKLQVNSDLDRTLVSFQANKKNPGYRWYKYKEGYSSHLVDYILRKLHIDSGTLIDPFAGSGTSLFAASDNGLDSVGIELLPIGIELIEVRKIIARENKESLVSFLEDWVRLQPWINVTSGYSFQHLNITRGAFPAETEELLCKYLSALNSIGNDNYRRILRFALICILEEISFTRKDGQYLRWDYRSGKGYGKVIFDKGEIKQFNKAISAKLEEITTDIVGVKTLFDPIQVKKRTGETTIIPGSCLKVLPTLGENTFDVLVTSPPYCNRYDYTRTYALELALLEVGETAIRQLRQDMMSCTVENRDKENLIDLFSSDTFKKATSAYLAQNQLQGIINYLEDKKRNNELNNSGIVRMVKNYFHELTLIIFECARVLKKNAYFVMVNDNVRYAGVEIPVDLILSDIAQNAGFSVEVVWQLPTGKGNSSQQMGVHGRSELRKCVYVWRKL